MGKHRFFFLMVILFSSCELIIYDLLKTENSEKQVESEDILVHDTIPILQKQKNHDLDNSSESIPTEEIDNEKTSKNKYSLNWSNPVMGPYGASLGNFIRAYFLVGEFDIVKKFLINADCIDDEEFKYIMRNSNWGYDIDFTNIHKKNEGSFVMTYKTLVNNTTGIDQYYGKVVNDTAKLYFHSLNRTNPLVYDSKYPSSDINCKINFLLKKIQFDFDSADLNGESKKIIKQIASYLLAHPNIKIKISGHTSNEGSLKYNNKLSYDRANSVKTFLKSYGLNNEMEVFGFGSSVQIYYDKINSSKNRRVEIDLE